MSNVEFKIKTIHFRVPVFQRRDVSTDEYNVMAGMLMGCPGIIVKRLSDLKLCFVPNIHVGTCDIESIDHEEGPQPEHKADKLVKKAGKRRSRAK